MLEQAVREAVYDDYHWRKIVNHVLRCSPTLRSERLANDDGDFDVDACILIHYECIDFNSGVKRFSIHCCFYQ